MLAPDQIDFLLKHFQIPLQASALPCEAPQVGFSFFSQELIEHHLLTHFTEN